MILIEFEGGKAQRFRMEFHPLVTVVEGFNESQRRDIASRLQGAMTGVDVGFDFSVDIGGEQQALTRAALDHLGLIGAELDNLIKPIDLPGAQMRLVEVVPDVLEAVSQIDAAEALLTARHDFDAAQTRITNADEALDRARNPRSPIDPSVIQDLEARHEEARTRVGQLTNELRSLPAPVLPEEKEKRIARLESIAHSIRDRTKELRVEIERMAPPAPVEEDTERLDPNELADAWVTVEQELTAAQPQRRSPQWLIDQARAELVFAREKVEELKAFGSGAEFERAQQALVDAQAVWVEVEGGEEDPSEELRQLRADIYTEAIALIGQEVDADYVEYALRNLKADADKRSQPPVDAERERVQRDLAASILDHQDVVLEINTLRNGPAPEEPTPEELEERNRLTVELTVAEIDEIELGERLAELQVAARRVPLPNPAVIAAATEERDNAAKLAQDAILRIERFTVMAAEQAALETSATEAPVEPQFVNRLDVSEVTQSAVEVFVLSRVANLRKMGLNESVPMIIDAAFDPLPIEQELRLLNLLGSIASTVQVIYLASTAVAVEWAQRQNELLAAVVRLERI